MKNGNISMANNTLADFIYYLVDKVDNEQEAIRFYWQGRVLITIEPTTEEWFEDGVRLDYELRDYLSSK